MTSFSKTVAVCLIALGVASCGASGRDYPPGYTDDGIRFLEAEWHFMEADDVHLSYIGDGSSDPMITCERPALRVMAGALEFRTSSLEPL